MSASRAPERASALVLGWAGIYTRRLPRRVAAARRAELTSDLWEQRAAGAAAGASPLGLARDIVVRMLAGVPADVSWRWEQTGVRRERVEGRIVMVHLPPLGRVRRRLGTRRCRACGERYRRSLPYCPACKVRPGHDGIEKSSPNWGAGFGGYGG